MAKTAVCTSQTRRTSYAFHITSQHLQVDLPGIIHAMESGADQADYPALVKGMARDYISRPASIIVAVVTCKEDLDTQVQ